MPFVSVAAVSPPHDRTILARYGGAIVFVAFSRAKNIWLHLHNGRETEIAEPPAWWQSDDEPSAEIATPLVLSTTPKQLTLSLDDSSLLSRS